MEKTKKPIFKIVLTFLLFAAVVAAVVYVVLKGDLKKAYLSIGCAGVSFLISLLFIGKVKKKVYLTLALAANVAAYYFWVFDVTAGGKNNRLIAICIFLAAQLFFMFYSLSLTRAIFLKILDLALRVAACLLIWFVVKKHVTLTRDQTLGLMYLANALVTLLAALVHIKTEWLTFIGLLLSFVAALFTWLIFGGAISLKLSTAFIEFLLKNYKYIVFATFAVGNAIIALSSAWATKRTLLRD